MDTSILLEYYMQRPASIAHMDFGKWFNDACKLNDKELTWCNKREALEHILKHRHGERPNIAIMMREFNKSFKD